MSDEKYQTLAKKIGYLESELDEERKNKTSVVSLNHEFELDLKTKLAEALEAKQEETCQKFALQNDLRRLEDENNSLQKSINQKDGEFKQAQSERSSCIEEKLVSSITNQNSEILDLKENLEKEFLFRRSLEAKLDTILQKNKVETGPTKVYLLIIFSD